jgi:hypothetical protein
MRAVANVPSVRGITVSNFDEMRLSRRDDTTRYEQAFLTDIHSAFDLRRLFALFSQRTLLGDRLRDSLLEQLYSGRLEMMVPPAPGRIRLVQQVIATTPDQTELPFYRLEDALRRDMQPTLVETSNGPYVENERLIFTQPSPSGEPEWVLEATRGAVLQCSQDIEDQRDGQPLTLLGSAILLFVREFLRQAAAFYTGLRLGIRSQHRELDAAWYLDGIADASYLVPRSWCCHPEFPPGVKLTAQHAIRESQMTMSKLVSLTAEATEGQIIPLALRAVRELLYPFSIIEPGTGRTRRAIPQYESDSVKYTAD